MAVSRAGKILSALVALVTAFVPNVGSPQGITEASPRVGGRYPTQQEIDATQVPMLDVRAASVDAARSRAARESENTIVVIFGADNKAFFDDVKEAMKIAIATARVNGAPNAVGMLIVANGRDEGNFADVYLQAIPFGPRDAESVVIPIRQGDGDITTLVYNRIIDADYVRVSIDKEAAGRGRFVR